jgi:hypothetical protein
MSKRKPPVDLRQLTGMHLSRVARGWYWTAWTALLAAQLALLFAEVLLRLPDGIGNYPIEAALGMLAPFLALFLADHLTVEHYLETWRLLKDAAHASIVLEPKHIERVRYELRHHWLLRWVRPAKTPTIGAQLFAAALWWQAVVAPEGTPWLKRYWEPLGMACGGLIGALVPAVIFFAATGLEVFLTNTVFAIALACAALGLGLLSLSLLRTTARWQAIVDYFAA